jgi:hypothetical protein
MNTVEIATSNTSDVNHQKNRYRITSKDSEFKSTEEDYLIGSLLHQFENLLMQAELQNEMKADLSVLHVLNDGCIVDYFNCTKGCLLVQANIKPISVYINNKWNWPSILRLPKDPIIGYVSEFISDPSMHSRILSSYVKLSAEEIIAVSMSQFFHSGKTLYILAIVTDVAFVLNKRKNAELLSVCSHM